MFVNKSSDVNIEEISPFLFDTCTSSETVGEEVSELFKNKYPMVRTSRAAEDDKHSRCSKGLDIYEENHQSYYLLKDSYDFAKFNMIKEKIFSCRARENKLQLKGERRKLEDKLRKRLKNRRNKAESNGKRECQQRRKKLLEVESIQNLYCGNAKRYLKSQCRKLSDGKARSDSDVVIISDESVSPVLNFYRKETLQQNHIRSGYNIDDTYSNYIDHHKKLQRKEASVIQSVGNVFNEIESPKNFSSMYFPAIQGCRSVYEFQYLNRIDEGSYGVVYRARDKRTGEVIALKRIKMEKQNDGFPITSLREIKVLLTAEHPNIVKLREIVFGCDLDKIFIVMDYIEHDLRSLIETMKFKNKVFNPAQVKCLMEQLLHAVLYLHDNWILHRDLKTSNVLLSGKGILKVGDFGSAREYNCPVKPYTPVVVTLWYRPPELLLSAKDYSTPVDMWSVGCIFAELLSMEPLFPGNSVIDQLKCIFKILGTPNEETWPGVLDLFNVLKMTFPKYQLSQLQSRFISTITGPGLNLLSMYLIYDPAERITAERAANHDYFTRLPHAVDPVEFTNWLTKLENECHEISNSPSKGFEVNAYEGFHIVTDPVDKGFRLKF